MGMRRLWLDDRFLADGAARDAHGAAQALGAAAHTEITAVGDRLAGISAGLAQQVYRHAAAVWRLFGAGGFRRWVRLGEELAGGECASRDAALAFFAAGAECFGVGGLDTAAAWVGVGTAVAAVSKGLAAIFFDKTAPVLSRRDGVARLRAWADVGCRLYREHGWRGEFLAQGYFRGAPDAVVVFDPGSYRLWGGAAAALYPVLRPKDFFAVPLEPIARWNDAERELFLRAILRQAATSPKHAVSFYREVPRALGRLRSAVRRPVLQILERAARTAPAAIAEVVPVAAALVRQVPRGRRTEVLGLVERVAARWPDAGVAALRSLPRVCEQAGSERVRRWFRTGMSVAEENPRAVAAFFALESRSSVEVLNAGSTAVPLERSQGMLRKYIQMLSGEPVSIRGVDGMRTCPPIEEFPAENEVALPLRMELLSTYEGNERLCVFLAAQLSGRREFGTYRFVPPDREPDPQWPPGSALRWYLDERKDVPALEDVFLFAEGTRIHHRLCAMYPGVAASARWAGSRLLERWEARPASARALALDALLALIWAGGAAARRPAWLAGNVARLMLRAVAPLADAGATVQDSMRVAEALVAALAAVDGSWAAARARAAEGEFELQAGDPFVDARLYAYDEGAQALGEASAAAGGSPERPAELRNPRIEVGDLTEPLDGGVPLTGEELQRLLDSGAKLRVGQATSDEPDAAGLYITDLIGKLPPQEREALRRLLGEPNSHSRRAARYGIETGPKGPCFFYDEWDYHIGDYRSRWCRLYELSIEGDSGDFFRQALANHAGLIPAVRREFQRLRPESYRKIRGLEDGEDFDLNAAIAARVDVLSRRAPTNKLYVARRREERDVATVFLLDMSASTDEPLVKTGPGETDAAGAKQRAGRPPAVRRVIDVGKEALIVMAAALEEIGDAYAIYGFSGHGRMRVEFYLIKSFSEPLNAAVKARIGGIEPKRSTRMGPSLRHTVEKFGSVYAKSKHLLLISDGFPQDYDYGQDRRSNVYGLRDTMVALREVEAEGITPFCITVDKAGHDYLRQMCDESRYMVIDDIESLPRELPKIYQRVVRG